MTSGLVVRGSRSSEGAVAHADPHIPLKIVWGTATNGQILHVALEGHDGGRIDLKADTADGALHQLTVTLSPPQVGGRPEAEVVVRREGAEVGVTPTLDLASLRDVMDSPSPDFLSARLGAPLAVSRSNGRTTYRLGRAGDVAVEYSCDGFLVRVGVSGEILDVVVEDREVRRSETDMSY